MSRCNCCCNHPCPIFCPCSLECSSNEVVNPVIENQFGYFNNSTTTTVASQGVISVTLSQSQGTSITQSSSVSGGINLLAGTYQVSYFANGTTPENENFSIKLEIDSNEVAGSVINVNQESGDVVSASQTIVISLTQSSTLTLVNNSANSTVITSASVVIRRI